METERKNTRALGLFNKLIYGSIVIRIKGILFLFFYGIMVSVIEQPSSINDMQQCKFTRFDIINFYLSITKPLLLKTLAFANIILTSQRVWCENNYACKIITLSSYIFVLGHNKTVNLFDDLKIVCHVADLYKMIRVYILDRLHIKVSRVMRCLLKIRFLTRSQIWVFIISFTGSVEIISLGNQRNCCFSRCRFSWY